MTLIAPEGLALTSEVANKVGINSSTGLSGSVVEFSSFSGFNQSDLWEWLTKVRV